MSHAVSKDPNVFLLPDLGEGLAEAELIKWRVEVGQQVNELDVLAEMETDKALVEVTSPRGGVIAGLHGEPGQVLKVGTPLVTYGAAGAAHVEPKPAAAEPAAAPRAPEPASNPDNGAAHAAPHAPHAQEEDAGTVVGDMSGGIAGVSAAPGKALATPAVRRLARDLGVDIDSIRGTGIGGRVMEKDVRGTSGGGAAPAGSPRKPVAACDMGESSLGAAPIKGAMPARTAVQPQRPTGSSTGRPGGSRTDIAEPMSVARPASSRTDLAEPRSVARSAASSHSGDEVTRIPFRGVRRTIANRLRESVNRSVHFTVMDETDVSKLDSLRRKLAAASGEKVSFLPFVAAAVCRVLGDQRFRAMNATVDERPDDENYEAAINQHRSVNMGIATDTDSGLMVPVIRDCDRLGVLEISRSIGMIAEMARNRSIPREQLIGSTFTISNVGSHAGRFATPIINYPEVGILAVGRAREGVIVNKGSFFAGLLLPLSLACDHRVVDGATAALALAEIVRLLQEPEGLMGPARG